MSAAIARAEAMLREACGDRLRTAFPLAPLTTFRIGGPASLYLELASDRDLAAAGEAVRRTDVPVLVIGKGSNLLIADRGFAGLVLRLGRFFRWAARDGDRLSAGAATPLPAFAGVAMRQGLSGLEFGVAIPATLGGAVRMNAGAHGAEMADVTSSIEVFELRPGRARSIDGKQAGFGYRRSSLPAESVVTGATLELTPASDEQIRAGMEDAREWRRQTQPLAEPNCGSVFTNPPGAHAAELIETSGAKGLSVGGASVSAKHANFIVTSAGATAADVVELIERVRAAVLARSGIRLETEVHAVGEFDRG
jgi:UDP-N-acetylmuramate dehydrogenase